MKKNLLFISALGLFLVMAVQLQAQDRGIGFGIIAGEPTGLSAKLWTNSENAYAFGLGLAIGGDRISYCGSYNSSSRIHMHIDYLWHAFKAINSSGTLPLYYGIGIRYNTGGGYTGSFGIRCVTGISWIPKSTPIDIFLEMVPVIQTIKTISLGVDAGLGLRYFFN